MGRAAMSDQQAALASIQPILNSKKKAFTKVYHNAQPRKGGTNNNGQQVTIGFHDGAQGDPLKWNLPGWRIEQQYSKNTLIGNWCEERNKFEHSENETNSTNRIDYNLADIIDVVPETLERRYALRRNEGSTTKYQPKQTHDQDCQFISWYDNDYRRNSFIQKPIRKWNRHKDQRQLNSVSLILSKSAGMKTAHFSMDH